LRVADVELDDVVTAGVTRGVATDVGAGYVVAAIAAITAPTGTADFVNAATLAVDACDTTQARVPATAAVVLVTQQVDAHVRTIRITVGTSATNQTRGSAARRSKRCYSHDQNGESH
jgi:hypothetical protein